MNPKNNLILIGFRGSGKSTVGRLLAEALHADFIDTDDLIARAESRSIVEIFEQDGEEYFRGREAHILAGLRGCTGAVISVGGGAIERAENRELIRGMGHVIWLSASADTLHDRMRHDPHIAGHRRPPLTHRAPLDETRRKLAERAPLYEQLADLIIETERQSPKDIVRQIITNRLHHPP